SSFVCSSAGGALIAAPHTTSAVTTTSCSRGSTPSAATATATTAMLETSPARGCFAHTVATRISPSTPATPVTSSSPLTHPAGKPFTSVKNGTMYVYTVL